VSASRTIARVVVPIAVMATFAIARRYFPSRSLEVEEQISAAESSKFQRFQWIVGAGMILFGVVVFWFTHTLLIAMNRWYSFYISADGIRLWPQPAIWWFFPFFAAICLAYEFVLQTLGAIGRREIAERYARWSDQKAGFQARKLLLWMALPIALPIGLLTMLEIPVHATLRTNDIIDCRYAFRGCETYQYSEARRLTLVQGFRLKDGSIQPRAGIVVDFEDGRRWNSADFGDFIRTVAPEVQNFLVAKTALPLARADTDADIGK
jgi:hypothetical protein